MREKPRARHLRERARRSASWPAREVLEQHVAVGEQPEQDQLERVALADDGALDLVEDRYAWPGTSASGPPSRSPPASRRPARNSSLLTGRDRIPRKAPPRDRGGRLHVFAPRARRARPGSIQLDPASCGEPRRRDLAHSRPQPMWRSKAVASPSDTSRSMRSSSGTAVPDACAWRARRRTPTAGVEAAPRGAPTAGGRAGRLRARGRRRARAPPGRARRRARSPTTTVRKSGSRAIWSARFTSPPARAAPSSMPGAPARPARAQRGGRRERSRAPRWRLPSCPCQPHAAEKLSPFEEVGPPSSRLRADRQRRKHAAEILERSLGRQSRQPVGDEARSSRAYAAMTARRGSGSACRSSRDSSTAAASSAASRSSSPSSPRARLLALPREPPRADGEDDHDDGDQYRSPRDTGFVRRQWLGRRLHGEASLPGRPRSRARSGEGVPRWRAAGRATCRRRRAG